MKYNAAIFIGRFQPFHNGHKQIVEEALKITNTLIIVIGSHNAPQSIRNPFETSMRQGFITNSLTPKQCEKIRFVYVQDSAYNFEAWLLDVKKKVSSILGELKGRKIALVGYYKDDTSYYLKAFPEWDFKPIRTEVDINSTDIRKIIYGKIWGIESIARNLKDKVSIYVKDIIVNNYSFFNKLIAEYEFIEQYKDRWKDAPFSPTFITTDAIVFCIGHVLVVDRKMNPGKGRIALPGGFLGQGEGIFDSCLRELREETKLTVGYKQLKGSLKEVKVFDHPLRDPRGRIVTHGHFFRLDEDKLPVVEGADDAEKAYWFPLHEIDQNENQFFSDHCQIIKYFINRGN